MRISEQITATLGTDDWIIVSAADPMGDGSDLVLASGLDHLETGDPIPVVVQGSGNSAQNSEPGGSR